MDLLATIKQKIQVKAETSKPTEVTPTSKPPKAKKVKVLAPAVAEGADESDRDWSWYYNMPDGVDQTKKLVDDTHEYGIIMVERQGKATGIYRANIEYIDKNVKYTQISNFTIRILYHIHRGRTAKRVVLLVNDRNREAIADSETNQLTSLQKFVDFAAMQGNFSFWGKSPDLQKVLRKLYDEEKPGFQIETLGWYRRAKFFVYANGIFDGTFRPVDKYGIVENSKESFYIPYANPPDEYQYQNERKFWYDGKSKVSFQKWAPLFYQTFGMNGAAMMLYATACLFSSDIFAYMNRFPLMFLYGEGGSGKGTLVESLQAWWGKPQPPIKISEKANTDKAKIRKLAQYVDAMVYFNEFTSDVDISVIKTLSGFYDRFGYERASMDTKFGTETVPINSGVVIDGNFYPADDDPLLQRLIVLEMNSNERSKEQRDNYDRLMRMNEKGITTVTGELLRHREMLDKQFRAMFRNTFDSFRVFCKDVKAPDRMFSNYAVLLTCYKALATVVPWPFNYFEMAKFLRETLRQQSSKRAVGGAVSNFWGVLEHLISTKVIADGNQFEIRDNLFYLRFSLIHPLYLEHHFRIYRKAGLNRTTLQDKLKDSDAFVESKANHRFAGNWKSVTSCMVFSLDKIGVKIDEIVSSMKYKAENEGSVPTLPYGEGQTPSQSVAPIPF